MFPLTDGNIFQWKVFTAACVVGSVFELFGSFTIILKGLARYITWNIIKNDPEAKDRKLTPTQVRDFIELEFIVEDPAGSIIGLFERVLYVYSLCSQETVIIGGILTFKAFSGWFNVYDSGRQEVPSQTTQASSIVVKKKTFDSTVGSFLREMGNLTKLNIYLYAVGNLMSLVLSVLSFELVRYFTEFSSGAWLLVHV